MSTTRSSSASGSIGPRPARALGRREQGAPRVSVLGHGGPGGRRGRRSILRPSRATAGGRRRPARGRDRFFRRAAARDVDRRRRSRARRGSGSRRTRNARQQSGFRPTSTSPRCTRRTALRSSSCSSAPARSSSPTSSAGGSRAAARRARRRAADPPADWRSCSGTTRSGCGTSRSPVALAATVFGVALRVRPLAWTAVALTAVTARRLDRLLHPAAGESRAPVGEPRLGAI